MPAPVGRNGLERSIPSSDRQALIDLANERLAELPDVCATCPAAYLCAMAMNEDEGFGFPRTPNDVRKMTIRYEGSGSSMFSGEAQFALKSIVAGANRTKGLVPMGAGSGPSEKGDRCCLDPQTVIDINKPDPYRGW